MQIKYQVVNTLLERGAQLVIFLIFVCLFGEICCAEFHDIYIQPIFLEREGTIIIESRDCFSFN